MDNDEAKLEQHRLALAETISVATTVVDRDFVERQIAPLVPGEVLTQVARRLFQSARRVSNAELERLPSFLREAAVDGTILVLPGNAAVQLAKRVYALEPDTWEAGGALLETKYMHEGSRAFVVYTALLERVRAAFVSTVREHKEGAVVIAWPNELSPKNVEDWLREHAPDKTAIVQVCASLAAGGRTAPATIAARAVAAWLDINRDAAAPFIAIDIGRPHRGVLGVAQHARPARGRRKKVPLKWEQERDGLLTIQLEAPNTQIELPYTDRSPETAIQIIRTAFGDTGVRNWLVLLALATKQGRNPRFVWTLEDHIKLLGWNKRKRYDQKQRAELVQAVAALTKLWLVTPKETKHPDERGRRLREPLLKVNGVEDVKVTSGDWQVDAVHFEIHPALYEGVRGADGKLNRNYFPGSLALIGCKREGAPGLGALLAFPLGYDRRTGYSSIKGEDLLKAAGLPTMSRRMDKTWTGLRLMMEELHARACIGRYEWAARAEAWTLDGVCRIYPSLAVLERYEGVIAREPRRPLVTAGRDLDALRQRSGLTQLEMARLLEVTERTYRRLAAGQKPLAPKYRDRVQNLPVHRGLLLPPAI